VVSNIWKRIRLVSRVSFALGFATLAMAQTPTLRLDKHFFFPDESVRFWIGTYADDPNPDSGRKSGAIHIVRPDGSKFDQPVSSPIDGDPSRGWRGAWGLGPGPYLLGTYRLIFEFAGERTEEQSLEIVPNPFAGGVQAHWVFREPRRAVLRVENHTDRMVRLPELGLIGSEVSITIHYGEPRMDYSRFVPGLAISPPHATPQISLNSFDWTNISRWPMVAVPPGQSVERTVDLATAFPFQEGGGDYSVTLGVTLTLFVGEASDSEARLYPERRDVRGDTRFRW
jgi:hypothetical protein